MCEYIDDNDNMLYHVLFSFFQFLDAVYCFHKYEDKHIKNIALDSMYVHIRGISDFFSSRSCYQDDLKYNDFIDATIETNELPEDVREYINKTTAHNSVLVERYVSSFGIIKLYPPALPRGIIVIF